MAKIKVKEVKCPCCGANLSLKDQGYGEVTCKYCNAIVFISREDTNDGSYTVCNKADGKPIALIQIPLNWDVTNTFINYQKSTIGIPYSIGFDLTNTMGDAIHVETGNSYAINGAIAWVNRQTPHTVQKEFMTVEEYLDAYVEEFAQNMKKDAKFKEELEIPVEDFDEEKDFNLTKKNYEDYVSTNGGGKFRLKEVYSKNACRAYSVGKQVVVAYTKVYGCKYGMFGGLPKMGNLFAGSGNLLNKMADSGLLGGMLGKKFKNKEVKEEPKVEVKEEKEETLKAERITNPGQGDNIEWESTAIFLLVSTEDNYQKLYKKAFKQVCSSFALSPEVNMEHENIRNQYLAEANQMYQAQAQAQYQNGQNLINIGAQRMAANQSYVNSMMERSNRQYQSQRSSYNSRMAAQDRMRDQRTEAILGVNTYIKPDGKEVEVPVSADTAWINGKGEIVGGSVGFDPGSGWTKLERK